MTKGYQTLVIASWITGYHGVGYTLPIFKEYHSQNSIGKTHIHVVQQQWSIQSYSVAPEEYKSKILFLTEFIFWIYILWNFLKESCSLLTQRQDWQEIGNKLYLSEISFHSESHKMLMASLLRNFLPLIWKAQKLSKSSGMVFSQ
jgi:hypothetical protein